ncbi:MAG TPA: 30S ribosomal protein S12 methylthiotransferase RimO [Spirochaetia bacterium]|nr:30S ribosomal protein S12 methylthiotransferase RimO [Spirochaetia bacterium]
MAFTVGLISLGCAKNLVDSEVVLGLLSQAGYEVTPSPDEADILIVNTCAFIEAARKESIQAILEAGGYKKGGKCRLLLVTGCLAQRYPQELLAEIPEIDGLAGTGAVPAIVGLVSRALNGERVVAVGAPGYTYSADLPRLQATQAHTAYLKIAEGCSNRCSFCVIPDLRGPSRSRPLDELLREAAQLQAKGVRELILVAQDTTLYGQDLDGRTRLPELLRALDGLAIPWIRLLYAHPARITPTLMETMAGARHVLRYLDMPLQHADTEVLRRMRRGITGDEQMTLVENLRKSLPGLVLRTTFLVGFPGESESAFQTLLDFMTRARFERAGVFAYSREEGTAACTMSPQVPGPVKTERLRRAMQLQKDISRQFNETMVGQTIKVLMESRDRHGRWTGRSVADAPGVDGQVFLQQGPAMVAGELVDVLVKRAGDYDLWGEPTI